MEDELLNYQEAMDWTDSMESEYKNGFKAGFEAGKQERDRALEMLNKLVKWYGKYEDNPNEFHPDQILCVDNRQDELILDAMKLISEIENLSK